MAFLFIFLCEMLKNVDEILLVSRPTAVTVVEMASVLELVCSKIQEREFK